MFCKIFCFVLLSNQILAIIGENISINWTKANNKNIETGKQCDFNSKTYSQLFLEKKKCLQKCLDQKICTHFTWTKNENGRCLLKSGPVSKASALKSSDPSIVCGIVKERKIIGQIQWNIDNQNINWALKCDFQNKDLKNEKTTAELCGPKCLGTSGCTHFTWTDWNGGTCWMKEGTASKLDAFGSTNPSAVCGIVPNSPPPPQASTINLNIINKCSFTIWPGFYGRNPSNSQWQLPFNGGWEQASGKTITLNVPNNLIAVRIWARTDCKNTNGQFICETGACRRTVDCAGTTGQPPASLAEFTFNGAGNQDFYDVSLVDGYNLPITIQALNPSSGSGNFWCKNPSCVKDLNSICPSDLKFFNSQGKVKGCRSACERYNTDQFCCRGIFNSPQKCQPTTWPINYASIFKSACPSAYSYAYDDPTSTFFCRNTNYNIIFC